MSRPHDPTTPPPLTKLTIPKTSKPVSRPTSSSSTTSSLFLTSDPTGMFLSPPVTPISSAVKSPPSRNDIFNEDLAAAAPKTLPAKTERVNGLGIPSTQLELVDVWDSEARKRRSGASTWVSARTSPSSTPGSEDPSTTGGFRIDYTNVLGRGLTSIVYAATLPSGEMVAAKVPVNDESKRILQREASILTYLHSLPCSTHYVIPFYGKHVTDDTFALCLKLCPQTMQEYISSKMTVVGTAQPLVGMELWKDWLMHLLSAIDFLHKAGIVHNDIKPHNILLTPSLLPLLTDFAVSTSVPLNKSPALNSSPSLWPVENVLGTTVFTAPELLSAEDVPMTPEADVYSLGITMFVAAFGTEPFGWTKSVTQKIMLKKRGDVFAGMEIRMAEGLVEIIRGLCELDPGRRWDSSRAGQALHRLA